MLGLFLRCLLKEQFSVVSNNMSPALSLPQVVVKQLFLLL